ncbi:MAG: type IV pilus assembly protein PilM [Parcubacteria group bacterium Gr01-1014_30]|nr:MAG: type IV pilus assembly protein PilM [Parcubacteria group bacterium Gr01-1014_30]
MFNFFGRKPFGLDISDYSIEMISLSGSPESPRLLSMGRVTLAAGIVEDGVVLNKEKLKERLLILVEKPEFGKLKTRQIIFSLPESKSFIHILPTPQVVLGRKERQEVESQIERIFPYPLSDLYFDYKIRQGAAFAEILAVAAPKKVVDDYLEVFRSCRLLPIALEIESESLTRSLVNEADKPFLIADIGARTTNFSVFDENGLRLSISLPVAGNRLTHILAEKLKVSWLQAENLKREVGLNPDLEKGKIFLILQKEIQKIISEIKKIDDYFQEKTKKEIKKIVLAGGSANLPRLADYLSENLEKPAIVIDPWININIDILRGKEYLKKALLVDPVLYSSAIGSALRGLFDQPEAAGLNLLPKSREK